MPDTRKHILVEPDTHKEFMVIVVENNLTQDKAVKWFNKNYKKSKK